MTPTEAKAVLEAHGYQYQGTRQIEEPARSEIKAALRVLHTEAPPIGGDRPVPPVGVPVAEPVRARKPGRPAPAVTVRTGGQL